MKGDESSYCKQLFQTYMAYEGQRVFNWKSVFSMHSYLLFWNFCSSSVLQFRSLDLQLSNAAVWQDPKSDTLHPSNHTQSSQMLSCNLQPRWHVSMRGLKWTS